MLKKHSFSPGHKVVTGSKHNFHPQGAPTTASMGGPPQSVGGDNGPADGSSASGGMDGMNFCNGGMKYADGGNVFEKAGEALSRLPPTETNTWSPNKETKITPLAAGDKDQPSKGIGGQ